MQRAQLQRKASVSEKDGGLDSWFYKIPGRASFESFAAFACPPFPMVPNGFLALFRSSAARFRRHGSRWFPPIKVAGLVVGIRKINDAKQ
jgi:hypothetical protein